MQDVQPRCNDCGATISLPDSARYVTCATCGADLEVRREGGAVFTATASPATGTRRDDAGMRKLELESQLNRLDLDWSRREEELMIRGQYGRVRPRRAIVVASVVMTVVGTAMGTVPVAMGYAVFVPVPLIFAAIGIWQSVRFARKTATYRREQREYERRRGELTAELGRLG